MKISSRRLLFFAALLLALWGLSSLGPLRTFLPNTLALTGLPGTDRTYLILFQNNAELRATGGFISAFAALKFKHGAPVDFALEDVYGPIDDHDRVAPTYPMDALLEQDSTTYTGYTFRDANSNPDFVQTVQEVLKFYHLTRPGERIDGVATVNFSVLEKIVGLYEPIRVERETFTQDTLFEGLENAVSDIDRHNLEALAGRKDILKTLAGTLARSMLWQGWKWRELSEIVTHALNEKEMMLYFARPGLERKMVRLGWSGTLPSDGENMLAVNVSNFGGMKSDRYLTREVHYKMDTEARTARVEVTLRHHGEYNTPLSGEYKGYVRVIVPASFELAQSSTGTSHREPLGSVVAWGDTLVMQPGETLDFTYDFTFSAPEDTEQARLTLVKQSGTAGDYYEVTVRAPVGESWEASSGVEVRENLASWKGRLTADTTLDLKPLPDVSPPRLFWQEVRTLNLIELSFAEPLNAESATDPLNYEIRDLNVNAPDLDDGRLLIELIQVDGGAVRIYTRGMDLQPEEHYSIILKNLRDRSGNLIRPNPRTVTVVQRLAGGVASSQFPR